MKTLVPPQNYELNVSGAFWWCLLFGSFYFLYKGSIFHAIVSFLLAIFTFGLSWLIYPFFAETLIVNHYLQRGWQIKTK